jgi:hypothetical protein
MARYSKIERCILNDQKFNSLCDDAKLVFLILLIHPHLTAIGAMRATLPGLASELGWSIERLRKAFAEASKKDMVRHDEKACLIWLPNYLKHNRPESPNVVKSWEQSLDYLPECHLKNELIHHVKTFVNELSAAFQEALPEIFLKPCERLREGLPQSVTVAVTVTEAVAITGTGAEEQDFVALARPRVSDHDNLAAVFSHWKTTLQHPNAVLDEKRKKLIRTALKMGYSVAQLCDAITGCSYTPHNIGDNDRGQRYDGLHVILRDADQIDRFIRNAHNPPRPPNPADKLMKANITAGQNWLRKKLDETENPNADE